MPFFPVIAILFGFGGVLFGADQHDQRKREQANFRAQLDKLQIEIFIHEFELIGLRVRLDEKNSQVAQLALKVEQLKALYAQYQKLVA